MNHHSTLHQTARSSLDIWEHAAGEFEWEAEGAHSICMLRGRAVVQMPDGRTVRLHPGSGIFLPQGTRSRWRVEEEMRLVSAKTLRPLIAPPAPAHAEF